jgi:hypothetical protein
MQYRRLAWIAVILLQHMLVGPAAFANPGALPSVEWIRQFGTVNSDNVEDVAADSSGNVYITGWTNGGLGGVNAGSYDTFVTKFSSSGVALWTRQFGTASFEQPHSISTDGLGSIYVAGETSGNLAGAKGSSDAFLTKFDEAGNRLWTRQVGTSNYDTGTGVSADGLGNVYLSGSTQGSLGGPSAGANDAFINKFDANGNLMWARQFGTPTTDEARDVAADGLGNIFISGLTNGALAGPNANGPSTSTSDLFVARFDDAGNQVWTRQFGNAENDESLDISVDKLGSVFFSGRVGDPSDGFPNAFAGKYEAIGDLQWMHELGTASVADYSFGLVADGFGNLYASGGTAGFSGGPGPANTDVFVSKYDTTGAILWTQVLGTLGDHLMGVAFDGIGNVYAGGTTFNNLGGSHAGRGDAFLIKITDPTVPEPTSIGLITMGLLLAAPARRPRGREIVA